MRVCVDFFPLLLCSALLISQYSERYAISKARSIAYHAYYNNLVFYNLNRAGCVGTLRARLPIPSAAESPDYIINSRQSLEAPRQPPGREDMQPKQKPTDAQEKPSDPG